MAVPRLFLVHAIQMTLSCRSLPQCTLAALLGPSSCYGKPTAVQLALILPYAAGDRTAPQLAAPNSAT
jgi:hypothetical protein